MKKDLIAILKGVGFDSNEIKDILLYTLNTKDRQEQLFTWLLDNKDTCDKRSVQQKAQEILHGFLASNPYNQAAKHMPAPKWEAPPPPVPKPTVSPPNPNHNAHPTEEDPFDRIMTIFSSKVRA